MTSFRLTRSRRYVCVGGLVNIESRPVTLFSMSFPHSFIQLGSFTQILGNPFKKRICIPIWKRIDQVFLLEGLDIEFENQVTVNGKELILIGGYIMFQGNICQVFEVREDQCASSVEN